MLSIIKRENDAEYKIVCCFAVKDVCLFISLLITFLFCFVCVFACCCRYVYIVSLSNSFPLHLLSLY
jgi:hypothetical protein